MSTSEPHLLSSFDESLERLQALVLTMASLCRRNFEQAASGLLERDRSACSEVIADEQEINHLEKMADHSGIDIITRFQPVATDLRTVISNMKVANNLERIGDQSVNIARRARRLLDEVEIGAVQRLGTLFQHASSMLHDAILAYNEKNSDLAYEVIQRDLTLDEKHKELTRDLTLTLHNCDHSEEVVSFVDLLFVIRAIERVGDHAKNIAEETIFTIDAVDIRHGGAPKK